MEQLKDDIWLNNLVNDLGVARVRELFEGATKHKQGGKKCKYHYQENVIPHHFNCTLCGRWWIEDIKVDILTYHTQNSISARYQTVSSCTLCEINLERMNKAEVISRVLDVIRKLNRKG